MTLSNSLCNQTHTLFCSLILTISPGGDAAAPVQLLLHPFHLLLFVSAAFCPGISPSSCYGAICTTGHQLDHWHKPMLLHAGGSDPGRGLDLVGAAANPAPFWAWSTLFPAGSLLLPLFFLPVMLFLFNPLQHSVRTYLLQQVFWACQHELGL